MTHKQCGLLKVLHPSSFYLIPWSQWDRYFNSSTVAENVMMLNTNKPIGVHVWNKLSANKIVRKKSDVLYMQLARHSCPRIWDIAPDKFWHSQIGPVFFVFPHSFITFEWYNYSQLLSHHIDCFIVHLVIIIEIYSSNWNSQNSIFSIMCHVSRRRIFWFGIAPSNKSLSFFNDAFQAKQIYISSRFPISSEVQGCVRLCSSLLLCSLVKMIIKLYQRGAASMNYAPL